MKKWPIAVLLLGLFSTFSSAQLDEKLNLYLGVGSALPVESFLLNPVQLLQVPDGVNLDFADDPTAFEEYYQTGLALNIGLDYQINSHFSLLASMGYNTFGFDSDAFGARVGRGLEEALSAFQLDYVPAAMLIEGGRASTLTGSVAAKVRLQAGFFAPYLMGGGGLIRVNQNLINVSYVTDDVNYYDRVSETHTNAAFATAGGGFALAFSEQIKPFVEGGYHLGLTDGDNTLYYSLQLGFVFSMESR